MISSELEEFLDSLVVHIPKREQCKSITKDEVIDLFISVSIKEIQNNYEIPRVNFIFSDESLEQIIKMKPDIKEDDLFYLLRENQFDINYPSIKVNNANLFFDLLTSIINEQIKLEYDYNNNPIVRAKALVVLRRIWLRMDESDFESIESFLKKQLDFLRSRKFDNYQIQNTFTSFDGENIEYDVSVNGTIYESTRSMNFRINNQGEIHDLPKILYDVREEDNEDVCYIYALQSKCNKIRNKKIERKLYKLINSYGVGNGLIHPNFIYDMILFFDMLLENSISHIKVPLNQTLSYDFHVLLSEKAKRDFEINWNKDCMDYLLMLKSIPAFYEDYKNLLKKYNHDKMWYNHVVGKEDFISKAKSENLANIFVFMQMIGKCTINEIPLDDMMYLDISINKDYKRKR